MILDLLSFWVFAWRVRNAVTASTATVFGVLVFSSAYFLASRLVFPSAPEQFSDLDTHYFRVRRTVFAMLIAMVAVQCIFLLSVPRFAALLLAPLNLALTGVLIVLMLTAAVIRDSWASTAVPALLIVRYLKIYVR